MKCGASPQTWKRSSQRALRLSVPTIERSGCLHAVGELMDINIHASRSCPSRARQTLSEQIHLETERFERARSLQSLPAQPCRCPCPPLVARRPPPVARRPPRVAQHPWSGLRFVLSTLLVAEDFLVAQGVEKAIITAGFRSCRIHVLRSFSLDLGSLLVVPRVVRDEGSNTDETRLPNESGSCFIYPDIQTYATPSFLAKHYGTHALGKAFVVETRCDDNLDLSDAGEAPRRFTNWAPARLGRSAMLVELGERAVYRASEKS